MKNCLSLVGVVGLAFAVSILGVSCNVGAEVQTEPEKIPTPEASEVAEPVAEVTEPAAELPETAAVEAPAPEWLSESFGAELINAKGEKVELASLKGKVVGVYFSAHWCPPCRQFTPRLVTAYNEMKAAGKPFEIVFASSDRDEKAMFNYMKETSMEWTAIPHGDAHKETLSKRFSVKGIPTFVILDETGALITKNGRGAIMSKGADAFDDWKK